MGDDILVFQKKTVSQKGTVFFSSKILFSIILNIQRLKGSDFMQITIAGTYGSTFFRDKKTGECAFTIQSTQNVPYRNPYGSINCFGSIPPVNKGLPIIVSGQWNTMKNGKKYLTVDRIDFSAENKKDIIEYLKSSAFYGIGDVIAENIIDYTGPNILDFVRKNKDAEALILNNVKGITQSRVHNMIVQLKANSMQQDIYQYVKTVGGDFENVDKLFSAFAENTIQTLKRNPYIGYKADMDFYLCDALAKKAGLPLINDNRVRSIIYTAFDEMIGVGNTYDVFEDFMKRIYRIETKSIYQEHLSPLYYTVFLKKMDKIILYKKNDKVCITKQDLLEKERQIVISIERLHNSRKRLPFDEDFIHVIEEKNKIVYGESQKKAFSALKSSGVKIITGGPGTGKTTTIKGFIRLINHMFPNEEVLLLSPTGRASQRMKEATSHPAYTVNKGLEYRPFENDPYPEKNRNNPLDANFIIVDEVSMMDTDLTFMLLDAIKNGSTLLLFGDADQLPSVGPGNILYDFLHIPIIEKYILDSVYRQNGESGIIENVKKIKRKEIDFEERDDFHIIRVQDSGEIAQIVKDISKKYYKKDNPYDLQVLSPVKKRNGGVFSLNHVLQQELNPSTEEGLRFGRAKFHMNDKVIFTKTNYEQEYYNGDIGKITGFADNAIDLCVNKEDVSVLHKDASDLSLAYAITIHKSQGSEFPVCIIVLPKTVIGMLDNNLLFTAVTRAKKEVYIISEQDALEIATLSSKLKNRKSNIIDIFTKNVSMLPKNSY